MLYEKIGSRKSCEICPLIHRQNSPTNVELPAEAATNMYGIVVFGATHSSRKYTAAISQTERKIATGPYIIIVCQQASSYLISGLLSLSLSLATSH